MAKKRQYGKVRMWAEHAPDSAMVDTDNPGWRQVAKEHGIGVDENDLLYQVFGGENQCPSLISLEIRRDVTPAIVLATLRKMVDLIDRHPEYLEGGPMGNFVWADLTVNDDGSLGPAIAFDENESPTAEQPAVA